MSARHRAAEARLVAEAPPPEDASAQLGELESVETKELEDLDIAEQDALDRLSEEIADRYGERIPSETDPMKPRASDARARPWPLRGARHREAIRRTPQGDRSDFQHDKRTEIEIVALAE